MSECLNKNSSVPELQSLWLPAGPLHDGVGDDLGDPVHVRVVVGLMVQ